MISTASDKPSDYYTHRRLEMVSFVPASAKRVLDIGCGDGGFGSLLKEHTPDLEVWGNELIDASAEVAATRLDKVCIGEFSSKLDLPSGYFDAIVFNDSLEHIADHIQALQLASKLLVSGGVVVASIPNVRYWPHVQHYLIDGDWEYENAGILDRTHLRFFTKRSIPREMSLAGFQVERIQGINPCWTGLKYKVLNLLAGGRLGDMRYEQFAVVARRD